MVLDGVRTSIARVGGSELDRKRLAPPPNLTHPLSCAFAVQPGVAIEYWRLSASRWQHAHAADVGPQLQPKAWTADSGRFLRHATRVECRDVLAHSESFPATCFRHEWSGFPADLEAEGDLRRLVDVFDPPELDVLARAGGDVVEVLAVSRRQHHHRDSRSDRGDHLFLDPAYRPHQSAQA